MFKKIDFSHNYRIESIPSKESKELAEKGLGSYPGTTFQYSVKYDYLLNRYTNTGLDINSKEVLGLNKEDREKATEWIKGTKEELESLIGMPDYLDVTKDGWLSDLCQVTIEVTENLMIRVNGHDNILRPSTNYKDKIALLILFNNPDFPKSKNDLGDPRFRQSKFYLTTDGETTTINRDKINRKRQANGYMADLFGKEPKYERAWQIAFYLGLVKKQGTDTTDLEIHMESSIFSEKDKDIMDKFIEACEMDNATLLIYNMFQIGVNTALIRVTADGYSRGHVNYKKTKDESVQYLLTSGMATELASLREEIAKKSKKQKALA